MKENTTKDMDVYSKDSTVIERPGSYAQGVKVGWTAPAKWWNWLFKNVTERLKDIFVTTTSIHNEIKNAVGGTLDPESDTQLKDRLEQMKKELADMTAAVQANLTALEATKAKPNGIASLDPDGRIPYSQLPESAMEFKGDWNASTNTPTLADGTGNLGDMYLVSVGGTVDLGSGNITFLDGDRVIYNQAGKWEKISGGSVKSVNGATPDDIGNVSVIVDSKHIANGAITTGKIADSAILTGKIADGAISTVASRGSVMSSKLADNSVYTQHIYSNSVTTDKIAGSAITTDKIVDGAVTAAKLAGSAVTAAKLADGAVTAAKLADGAVTAAKLAGSAVTTNKIAGSAVTTDKIAGRAITTDKIAGSAVTTDKIANGAITEDKCKSGSNLYMHYLSLKSSKVSAYFLLLTNYSKSITDYDTLLSTLKTYHSTKPIACSGRYTANIEDTYGLIYSISGGSTHLFVDVVIGKESYSLQSVPKEGATVNDNVFKIIIS